MQIFQSFFHEHIGALEEYYAKLSVGRKKPSVVLAGKGKILRIGRERFHLVSKMPFSYKIAYKTAHFVLRGTFLGRCARWFLSRLIRKMVHSL